MKQRWYRSNITKAVLIIMAHIMVIVMMINIMWIAAYPALREEVCKGDPAKEYKDSSDFAERMKTYSVRAAGGITARDLFETDGEYDPEKPVNIEEYYNSGTLEGKGDGELIYRLGDLLEWYDNKTDESSTAEQIMVCKKPDDISVLSDIRIL